MQTTWENKLQQLFRYYLLFKNISGIEIHYYFPVIIWWNEHVSDWKTFLAHKIDLQKTVFLIYQNIKHVLTCDHIKFFFLFKYFTVLRSIFELDKRHYNVQLSFPLHFDDKWSFHWLAKMCFLGLLLFQ